MLFLEDVEDYSLKLIEAVEQRPLLYDKRNKEYLNCNLKKKIWEEVGQLLMDPDTWRNMSDDKRQNAGRQAHKRWESLRSCFTRELRLQRESKPLPGAKKRRTYMYFNQLMFLMPTVDLKDTAEDCDDPPETKPKKTATRHRENKTTVTDLIPYSSPKPYKVRKLDLSCAANISKDSSSSCGKDCHVVVANSSKDSSSECGKDCHVLVANSSKDSRSACGKDCHVVVEEKKTTDCDEDHNFAMSLVPMLRRLGEYDKLDVKLEILTLFKNKCPPPPPKNANIMVDKLVQTNIARTGVFSTRNHCSI